MKLFPQITAETVRASQVPASSVPTIAGATGTATAVAADAGAPLRSIWDTIKSVFK
jgi:hypothetical protein